ncbi:MAG TPA: T9SS type A sorting domain-containing protein [Flavobacteriales bacterium]|nr:T9SS type A sorting domain-containing protein [Flavobacteriales bacterium]
MKLNKVLFGSLIVAACAVLIGINFSSTDKTVQYSPRVKQIDQTYFSNVYGIAGAIEYYNERRKNIKTGKIEIADMLKAEKAVYNFGKMSKQSSLNLNWIEMGPDNVGGRTRSLLIDNTNPNKMWAGSVGGGLFVTHNGGFTWSTVNDKMNNLSIGCICQSGNGDIYVGTGESFTTADGLGTLTTPGFVGRGMFKSTDNGLTFDSLDFTVPTNTNSSGAAWAFINRCAADPTDVTGQTIYAATNNGLLYTTDGGTSWTNAICLNCPSSMPIFNTGNFQDVKIGSNGVLVASNGGTTYIKKPGSSDFINISNNFNSAGRYEFAIAPSNPDYIYVVCGNGSGMRGVYQSTDGGDSWTLQVPAGPSELFRNQAEYDMALAVFPDDPEHILVGGVELYAWSGTDNTWDIVALTQPFAPGLYVHADKHAFAFHPNYNGTSIQTFYVGTDGGVYGSFDAGASYLELNTGYNVTQFYAMGVSREGWIAGGTQDNGNPFIDFSGNTKRSEVRNLPSGDGGYMQFSIINPEAFFWESQGGDAKRSPEKGDGAGSFFANVMCNGPCDEDYNEGPWVTPMVIWESFNDLASTDSVRFIADQAYNAGSTIFIESSNDNFPFEYITPVPLSVNDTMMIQDLVQNKFLVSTNSGTWMCKNVLDFSVDAAWYKLTTQPNQEGATCAAFSADGDIAYISTGNQFGSLLFRISGLLGINSNDNTTEDVASPQPPASVTTTQLFSSSQFITGIGVDPNNAENVVITLGNYGNTNHVYVSSTAASATGTGSFSSIQGDLPPMPCYDAIIEMGDSNTIIVATEYGVWATDNPWSGSPTWTNENLNFPRVPSFMIVQQTMPNSNCTGVSVSGNIYVATHGRGIWRCETYKAPPDTTSCSLPIGIAEGSSTGNFQMRLNVYPNPVTNGNAKIAYTLNEHADIQITVYDISGKQVQYMALNKQPSGTSTIDLDLRNLNAGTYLVSMTANGVRETKRLVVL